MKVFRLQARFASAASLAVRAEAAEGGDVAAARRDALARWRGARDRGLTADAAAKAVGVSRRTLFRWRERQAKGRLEPDRPGPRRPRRANRRPELVRAVEETRKEHPMWGKAKIAAAIAEELKPLDLAASESTVGRILADLVRRGAVKPVWNLRRKAPRAARSKRPWARRKPADLTPLTKGQIADPFNLNGLPEPRPSEEVEDRNMAQTLSEVVRKGKGFAVVLAAVSLFPTHSIAQTTIKPGTYPTPHIVTEGSATIRGSGLNIQYYVTEPDHSGIGEAGGGAVRLL